MPGMPRLPHPAIVSRSNGYPSRHEVFLHLDDRGAPTWTEDPAAATAFESMHEAARAAARLPATLRAYGLPINAVTPAERSLH